MEIEAPFQCSTPYVDGSPLNKDNPIFVLVALDLESKGQISRRILVVFSEYLENGWR